MTVENLETLRKILDCIKQPERLDHHPWAASLVVRKAVENHRAWAGFSRGHQLLHTIAELFQEMMPQTPPRKGKRLDTRWGRFGILAAQYFAPYLYGRLYPETLRDAWRRIDDAIILFVFGDSLNRDPRRLAPYCLIGDEPDMPANSTISDWHRGGLEVLLDLLVSKEQHISLASGEFSPVLGNHQKLENVSRPVQPNPSRPSRRRVLHPLAALVFGLMAVLAAAAALKIVRLVDLAQALKHDLDAIEAFNLGSLDAFDPASLDKIDLEGVGALLSQTMRDVDLLKDEVEPWYWVTSRLGWAPGYVGDLAQLENSVEMAASFLAAVDASYRSVLPIAQAVSGEDRRVAAEELVDLLLKSKPMLLQAQDQLRTARLAREQIDLQSLSPTAQRLILRADPYLSRFEELLALSIALPGLLGAAEDGPKTYLVLVQNEDELRPTGGFITAVGKVVVFKGDIVNWSVQDSASIDDPSKVYPRAPWQLRSFLNLPVFVLRDANWYTDYPTTVTWVEYLYAYSNASSVDGVIAIDQQALVSLISATGPIRVEEIGETVTSANIVDVMRSQKVPSLSEASDPNWNRKQFMQPIASAVLDRILSGEKISWKTLIKVIQTLLDQRHILVQVDDPAITSLLRSQGWDGAVRREPGDFLMVVDSNVGGNKTNAVVDSSLVYDVNLIDLKNPSASLVVFHQNNAPADAGQTCDQLSWRADPASREFWYPINQCYYNYLRVYTPEGAQLVNADPQPVSRNDMVMLDQDTPARVDKLSEQIGGVTGFGALLIVRKGQSLSTAFQYALPGDLLLPGSRANEQIYRLKIQKQGGIDRLPVTVRVHLPAGAVIQSTSPIGLVEGQNILFQFELTTDTRIEIVFTP